MYSKSLIIKNKFASIIPNFFYLKMTKNLTKET